LLLPGWNHSRHNWCDYTNICSEGLKKGYRLILPEMGKSLYSTCYYPETRPDLRNFPTRNWLVNILVPTLQLKHCILNDNERNFVIGLSYGGRGVALAVLGHPHLFTAAAALSGDYDLSRPRRSPLMEALYGKYEQFPERWEGVENPIRQVAHFQTPIYLGHGQKDTTANPEQTRIFFQSLRNHHPFLATILSMPPDGEHNYKYWDSEVNKILHFFEDI